MSFDQFASCRRAICVSYVRKHRFPRLVLAVSFITLCIIIFLKIQHFVEDLTHNSNYKTSNIRFWNDKIYVGRNSIYPNDVSLSNNERIYDSLFLAAEDLYNSSNKIDNRIIVESRHDRMNIQATQPLFPGQAIFSQKERPRGQPFVPSETETSPGLRSHQNTGGGRDPAFSKETERISPLLAVIVVISRPNNVRLRLAARRTWAEYSGMYKILVRFVVGRLQDWSDIVDRESSMHKDLIVFEQNDTVDVLPNKVIEGFEWALRQRPTPIYVMKIDDDTIVNLPYLVKELLKPTFSSSEILGAVRKNVKTIRDPNDQWAVSILDHPSPTYPPYAFGGGYVMHAQTAKTLLEKRYSTPAWVHLEDVYLTGFVAAYSGIGLKQHKGLSAWDSGKASACDFVLERRLNSVNNTEKEFYGLYKGIQRLMRSGTRECH